MKVVPSAVAGVELQAAGSEEFEPALAALLKPALPFSVIVKNHASRGIALLGVRFDMVGPKGKHYSVVHYSDTLRNPDKGDFGPGTWRFVCAEPEYTALGLKGGSAVQTRSRMNLDNLRRMLSVAACVDCVAFDDGQFLGPDSQKAFDRFAQERGTEQAFAAEALAREGEPAASLEEWLSAAAPRSVARKLLEGLQEGGPKAMAARAREHKLRIALWR